MDLSQDQRMHPQQETTCNKIKQIRNERRRVITCIRLEVEKCITAAARCVNKAPEQDHERGDDEKEMHDCDRVHEKLDACLQKLIHTRSNFLSVDEKDTRQLEKDDDDDTYAVYTRVRLTSSDDQQSDGSDEDTNPPLEKQNHYTHFPAIKIHQNSPELEGVTSGVAATTTQATESTADIHARNLEVVTDSSVSKNDYSTGSSLDSFERNENLIHLSTDATCASQIEEVSDGEVDAVWDNKCFISQLTENTSLELLISPVSDQEEKSEEDLVHIQNNSMYPGKSAESCEPPPVPSPPPALVSSSRRASGKFGDDPSHLFFRSVSSEEVASRMSDKRRKSLDDNDSLSTEGSGGSSEAMTRLSLPESLQVAPDESPDDPDAFDPSAHHPHHHSNRLLYRRSSLPRTREVPNMLLCLSQENQQENRSADSLDTQTLLSASAAPADVNPAQSSKDPEQPAVENETSNSSSAREAMISSVSSFTTASSEIFSDVYASQEEGNNSPTTFFVPSLNAPAVDDNPSDDNETGGSIPADTSAEIPIGTHVSVRISHINTPSDFYLHVNRNIVDNFLDEIQVLQGKKVAHQSHQKLNHITIGLIYGIRSSPDFSWFRVQVVDLFHDESKHQGLAEVFFIDYGKTLKLTTEELYCLHPKLLAHPPQAVHCCLRRVDGPSGVWSLKAIDEFRNSVSFYSMRALFHEKSKDAKYSVDLFLDWGADEMNNVLLYLSPTEFIPQDSFQHSLNQANQMTKGTDSALKSIEETLVLNFSVRPCSVPTDKDYLLALVSHVVSPSEFYLHVMSGEGNDTLDDLREQLNEHFLSSTLCFKFPADLTTLKGSFWAAIYPSDSSWYRVRVIEVLEEEEEEPFADEIKGKHALVQYIDFGNVQIVPLTDLKPLPQDLCSTPALALKCHLAHVTAFASLETGERLWSDEALTHFRELSGFENETIVTLSVLHRPTRIDFSCSLPVLLWNNSAIENEDILVNALLVSENLAFTESTDWMEDVDRLREASHEKRSEEREVDSRSSSSSPSYSPLFPLKQIRIDSIILLKVTYTVSPEYFYAILPYGSSSLDEVASLSGSESLHELIAAASVAPVLLHFKQLQDDLIVAHRQKNSSSNEHFHGMGSVVCARTSADEVFRARIIGYSSEDAMYEVQDMDRGSVKVIPGSQVCELNPEFTRIPAFAIKCCLANVHPTGGFWTPDAVRVFREHTEDKFFAAHVVSNEGEELAVELVGLDEENTISVCEFLVALGFACESPDPGRMSDRLAGKPPATPQCKKRPSVVVEVDDEL